MAFPTSVPGIDCDSDPSLNLTPNPQVRSGYTLKIAGTIQVGASGTSLNQITLYSPVLTPAAVGANTTAEQTFAVAGLSVSDKIIVNKPTAQAGLGIVGARVSAAGTLAITFSNNTAGAITPTAAETYQVVAIR